jgi:glycosyltransferase involved in cell wall biosynthesis
MNPFPTRSGRRLLLFISEDWYYWSHRRPIARRALQQGYRVGIVTRVSSLKRAMQQQGLCVFPLNHFVRRVKNPLNEIRSFIELVSVYRRFRPAISHHVALKLVLLGTLAAYLSNTPVIVNALAGLGFLFTQQGPHHRLLQRGVLWAFRVLFRSRRVHIIVQNQDDRRVLIDHRVARPDQIHLIPGSGVDPELFVPTEKTPPGPPVIMLASRMLWDKGIAEFVEAARQINADGLAKARFVLVGFTDSDNPASIPEAVLRKWHRNGWVEWWGYRADMPDVLRQAHIACLPSYREGMPKSLIEAAASGLPIVTTDTTGCRDIVQDGINGFLVPVRDSQALAKALEAAIADPARCRQQGRRGRDLVLRRYTDRRIADDTLALYEKAAAG